MVMLDVEKFDGEDVGGTMEFIESENQRRMIALADPPFGSAVKMLEIGWAGVFDDAEDVEVGVACAEFAGDRGAVEDDRRQVVFCGGL